MVYFPGGTYSILSVDITHGLTLVGKQILCLRRLEVLGFEIVAEGFAILVTHANRPVCSPS